MRCGKKIGGFDDRFAPAYCEDSDLAFEVRRRGYQVLYQPLSVVVHFEGVSNGTDTANGQKAYQVTNQKRFYEKWKNVLEEENFPNGQNVFLARDRSRNKKTLLMVDHYVPMYDKDAGSRTVFQYIKLFVNMGYNVKFIGDNFYPHQPYTQTLQQLGVEVLIGPYYAKHWKDWLKENGANIGYAFLNRPHIAANYIEEIRKHTNARIIYYGHDLHFLRERREYELTGDAGLLASSEKWKQKELALMRKADVAYYPSYIEKEEIQQLAPDVNVKAIPAYLFSGVEAQPYHAEMRRDAMFIGGFGHRPNVDAVKWLATEVMPHLLKRLPELTVYILGSNPPDEVKTLESEHLRIMGFVTDEELERYYSACRLDLVPLRYGAGIKGKVVEAMRYGMPVVTTSVGAEGISGADSILTVADSAEEFAQKAASLYQNGEELTARSAASYRYIREKFSPENARQIVGPDFDME
ncbi:glycosyltransferase [Agathobaculum sp. NTUH-O15-33]|uniref:glycosyltransferase n=1 Tax=Agathobaculum sp. NTUH-O15-33 TaxID=3079302 RepID=UPI00295841D9|nr:glycosyltransferase [Agathobaculum sp. NTUH-O15-33]WNX84095.1 glycosyltransferase [Agathobaculum sp. NTUH-O15-33]